MGAALLIATALCLLWWFTRPRCPESLEVEATAYNSLRGQTLGDPTLTAWGHRLEPGDRAIAVSRDLIALGLEDGVEVRVEGLEEKGRWEGKWVVRDKMASRWERKIDLYFGEDEQAAQEFGRRPVKLCFGPAADAGP